MNKVLKTFIVSLLVSGSFLTCTSVKAVSADDIKNNKTTINDVSQKYKVPNIPGTVKPKYGETGKITGSDVCFRRGPGTNYEIIDILQKGTRIMIEGHTKGWDRVIYNGIRGYVYSKYVSY
ncbi:hypothetical protein FDG09_16235 [Clostridium sporogenes]|uniref:SH3 domain-containing protein n=1 Tax=Clostridium sporogenes TaxID=1509 RepID=UPI0013D5CB9E|nr:SH3 domain-containing protein [Clostridium sporogenes]NFV14389.1 hypothetical protein [Clostridium sporogenes]